MTTEVSAPTPTRPSKEPRSASGKDERPPRRAHASGKKSNDHVYEAKRAEYEKKMSELDAEVQSLRAKSAKLNDEIRHLTASDGNSAAREELRGKISALRMEKDKIRAQKEPIFQKLIATQESLKSKQESLHSAKDKVLFKKPEDIDRKILSLEEQIESGSMKLIDEKKTVAEISKLRKARREMDAFTGQESSIADLRKAIEQYRGVLNDKDKELRQFDEQLKGFNNELTKLSSTRSANQGKIKTLIESRDALRKKMDVCYESKNLAYEDYQKANAAHQIWLQAENVKREESFVRRDIEHGIRNLEQEMQKLEMPACSDQIEQCLNIQNYLRVHVLKVPVVPASGDGHAPQSASSHIGRQVEKVSDEMILKKEEVADNYSLAPSKKSKAKAKPVALKEATSTQSLKLPFWVLSALDELKVNMVTNVEEAEQAIAALEKKKQAFEAQQKSKMLTVDSEKAAIQARIDEQKARLDRIPEEAALRLKQKKSRDATTTNPSPAKQQPEETGASSQ